MKRIVSAIGLGALVIGLAGACTESGSDRVSERPADRPAANGRVAAPPPAATTPTTPPPATTTDQPGRATAGR